MMKQLQFLLLGLFLMVACSKDDDKILANPGRMIKEFKLKEGQFGETSINISERTVVVKVASSADLTSITPLIKISEEATISPASGEEIDISEKQHYTYTVTAESGLTEEWEVEFQIVDLSIGEYGTYTISTPSGDYFMGISGDLLYNEKYADTAKVEIQKVRTPENGVDRWQKWHLIYHSTADGIKYYQIRNLHSGKFLTVPEGEDATDIPLGQVSELEVDPGRQLWRLDEMAVNEYEIINKKTGYAVTPNAATPDDISSGTKVVQRATGNATQQRWAVSRIEADSYRDDKVVSFFNRNEEYQGSVAFDQGTSVFLSWGPNAGKTLWITQDAWDGRSLQPNDMFLCDHFFSYGNSMFIQPSTTNWDNTAAPNITVTNYPNGRPRQIAEIQPGHTFAWPGPGIEIGNKVYIKTGEGINLTGIEQSMLILTQSSGTEWTKERVLIDGMSGQDPETEIGYATGMVKPGDGYVYAFGNRGFSFGYRQYLYVARFAESDPLSWTFWDGSEWVDQPTIDPAARIGEGLGNVTVSYVNGKYVLLTMDQGFNCDPKRNIYMATSNSPTGPFTERKMVYDIQEFLKGQYARYYTPAIHPQFDNGRNELLITYSLNFGGCGQDPCEEGYLNPYYYRIKAVRVPYEMIGL